MSDIRKQTVKGLQEGQEFILERTFTTEDVKAFAAISRDDNPIHHHSGFIASKGMRAPICHGLLVASMLTEIGGQIGWLASEMNMKFIKPVYIGDSVRCIFKLQKIDKKNRATADITFLNQNDDTVLKAILKGILPNQSERKILAQLL